MTLGYLKSQACCGQPLAPTARVIIHSGESFESLEEESNAGQTSWAGEERGLAGRMDPE